MEQSIKSQSSRKFWIEHIEAAEAFDGSLREHCRQHGLKPGSLSAYRKRLGDSQPRHSSLKKRGFVSVALSSGQSDSPFPDLPDPKWLAEFLKAWTQL